MRVSPLDIRKQHFKKVMRGADPEEVRMFLDVVASEYEKVIQDNAMMAERIRALDARVAEFRALEENMRNSLVLADRIATESRESSDREARRVIQDAHSRSERILEDARERLQVLVREIETLRGKKEVFARRFWTMIEGQIGVLQEHMADTVEVESLRGRVSQMLDDARSASEADVAESVARVGASSRPESGAGQENRAIPRAETERSTPERRDRERSENYRRESDRGVAFAGDTPAASRAPIPAEEAPRAPIPLQPDTVAQDGAPSVSDPSARRPVPRGLGRLLRGRQTSLPLGNPPGVSTPAHVAETVHQSDSRMDDDPPETERAEGFYEINASDVRLRGQAPGRREDETRDRG